MLNLNIWFANAQGDINRNAAWDVLCGHHFEARAALTWVSGRGYHLTVNVDGDGRVLDAWYADAPGWERVRADVKAHFDVHPTRAIRERLLAEA